MFTYIYICIYIYAILMKRLLDAARLGCILGVSTTARVLRLQWCRGESVWNTLRQSRRQDAQKLPSVGLKATAVGCPSSLLAKARSNSKGPVKVSVWNYAPPKLLSSPNYITALHLDPLGTYGPAFSAQPQALHLHPPLHCRQLLPEPLFLRRLHSALNST